MEAGSFGSDSGTVVLPTGDEPFPLEVIVYALIFVIRRNSFNIAVVF
jgi:hypothetical protein